MSNESLDQSRINPEASNANIALFSDSDTTPYTRSPEELDSLLAELTKNTEFRYIDNATNPDIGEFAVYKVPGANKLADLGRTLEVEIFDDDAGYEAGFLEDKFKEYDNNSIFLILTDEQNDKSKLVGALRIIDCSKGGSETIGLYKEFFGESAKIPSELLPQKEEQEVWDILSVVVTPEYRDGLKSAWLYYGLYKSAIDNGIEYWIANMTPKETRNLREYSGIPFKEVPGVEEVTDTNPNGTEATYMFYSIDVTQIFDSVSNRISELEADSVPEDLKQISKIIASVARIAITGRAE